MALLAELLAAFSLAWSNPTSQSLLLPPRAAAGLLEPNTQQVGRMLFEKYIIPFEIASILLLVALVGAVVMGKKRI
jgi:NADH:ubiquinone oxidoreductase subunit 6 (subunit J)